MRVRAFVCMLVFLCLGLSSVRAGEFESWCEIWPIAADPYSDPDTDGAINLLEYAFGGIPTDTASVGGVPGIWEEEADGINWLYLSYEERQGDSGLIFTILDNFDPEFQPWASTLEWEVVVEQTSPDNLKLLMMRTPIEFSQISVVVQVELDGGPAIWTEELSYPLAGGGGDYELTITSGSGSGSYSSSDYVEVIADPAPAGMEFASWAGDSWILFDSGPFSYIDFDLLTHLYGVISPPDSFSIEATYQPIPAPELSSITISGPSAVDGGSTNNYTCTAAYTDGSHSNVTSTAQWSVSGASASINASGVLSAGYVSVQENTGISASYTDGGVTKTDSFSVTIVNPALELDYTHSGTGSGFLVLSNQVFSGTAANAAAEISQLSGLEVYDCSFYGGAEGDGLTVQDVAAVYVVSTTPDFVIEGGDGSSKLMTGALVADGAHGGRFGSQAPSSLVFENIAATGGNGGFINPGSSMVMLLGVAKGGNGLFLDGAITPSVCLNGGLFEGGNGGDDGSYYGNFSALDVSGGHGVSARGGSGTDELCITDGIFLGGYGGFGYTPNHEVVDGGCGVYATNQQVTISGGMFVGGESGLGSGYGADGSMEGGDGVRVEDGAVTISGGTFTGGMAYPGVASGYGLGLEDSAASISGGNFDRVGLTGANDVVLSGMASIGIIEQLGGSSALMLSGFSGVLDSVEVDGSMTVGGEAWVLASGSSIKIGASGQLQVTELHALAGSHITIQPDTPLSGGSFVFNSSSDWLIDAGGNYFVGTVALATASDSLTSSLNAVDVALLGDGTTEVSSLYTSNSTLYAVVEEIEAGYDSWSDSIADAGQRGHDDSPDGDGIANLLKYACGLPPNSYVSNLFDYALVSGTPTNDSAFVITYQKAKGISDATVFAEHTGSLATSNAWSSAGMTVRKMGETAERETWEASIPFSTNGFMRLKAEFLP